MLMLGAFQMGRARLGGDFRRAITTPQLVAITPPGVPDLAPLPVAKRVSPDWLSYIAAGLDFSLR
jgi:hypothetical protein